MCFLFVFLKKSDFKKYILYTASTKILNMSLPTISPNESVGLLKSTADTLVTNSGRDVIDAIKSPPMKAEPNFVCLDNLSP